MSTEYRKEILEYEKRHHFAKDQRAPVLAPDSGLYSQSFRPSVTIDSTFTSATTEERENESESIREEETKEEEKRDATLRVIEGERSLDEGFESHHQASIAIEDVEVSDDEEGEGEGENISEAFPEIVAVSEEEKDDEIDSYTKDQGPAHYYVSTEDPRYLLAPYYPQIMTKDEEGDTALHLAIIHGNPSVLIELMQSLGCYLHDCVNVQNKLGQTLLHLAVALKQSHIVRILMDCGARVDVRDWRGNNPLHIACRLGDVRSLTEMLKEIPQSTELPFEISDLSQLNYEGFAPIHLAVLSQSADCVHSLCIAGADVDIEDGKSGRRALHHAVELDNLLLITKLIYDCEADVNAINFDGSTPLHFAAGRGLNATTALLVASGAQTAVWNYEGDSPYDISVGKEIRILCQPIGEEEDSRDSVEQLTCGVSHINIARK